MPSSFLGQSNHVNSVLVSQHSNENHHASITEAVVRHQKFAAVLFCELFTSSLLRDCYLSKTKQETQ